MFTIEHIAAINRHIAEIKELLGIEDTLQDKALESIITITTQRLLNRLYGAPTEVPQELSYIVTEVSIARFNRLGSEHLKSDSDEGHTLTWYDNDDMFLPFHAEIAAWNATASGKPTGYTPGRVIFL